VTAFVLLFPRADGVDIFPYFWIPEENISKRAAQDQRVIRSFADAGYIEVTEGNEVDVMRVAERIMEISAPFDLRRIGFDPWNAAGPTQRMKELGLPDDVLIKMVQGTATYNEPIKQLLSMLGSGRFRHDGNKVLRWMASNAAGLEDSNGNLKFHKGKSGDKIDGMTALGMALALYITENPESSAYKKAGSGVILF
jgi:phage terminase large subunit-like protein